MILKSKMQSEAVKPVFTVLAFLLIAFAFNSGLLAQESITFTLEQVESGEELYQDHCEMCHGTALNNGQFGAPVRGRIFRDKWSGKSLGELAIYTYEEMPQGNGASLPKQIYTDILAFILEANNIGISESAGLSNDYDALTQIPLPW